MDHALALQDGAIGVGLEGEAAELVGNEAVAGLVFALAHVEEKKLLEVGGRQLTTRRMDEIKQEFLALVEHGVVMCSNE